jgi:hypothetical protein
MPAKFNSAEYSAQWVARHHSYERQSYRNFKKALDQQVKAISAHVRLYGSISQSTADLLITKKPIEEAYKKTYTTIGVRNADFTRRWINSFARKKDLPGFFSDKWTRLMELFFTNHSARRVSDVTETTREKVRRVLADSEGLPISERATYIEDTLDDPAFNRNRALMIARTETTTAANYGASLGNEDADYDTNKQWIAVMDSNTRPDHADADGQVVANTDNFEIGSYLAQYPGAITLPASEVVNCRCAVAYVPVLVGGLAVLKG